MNNSDDLVSGLRNLLANSSRAVVFTGAGVSTESGIPDFRSPGGIWTNNRPIDFSDFLASEEMRREAWRRKFKVDGAISQAVPNDGHRIIADWIHSGPASLLITQNVDGLHQASGIPDEYIVELHGNTTYAHCLDCAQRYELAPIRAAFEADESLPVCSVCDGIIKTATISFGQAMPQREMGIAEQGSRECDLFLVIGSSLVVYPAAGLPVLAKRSGAKLVIINREPTALDDIADLVLNCEIGEVLSRL
jgi:NAD-dependent deacetylase